MVKVIENWKSNPVNACIEIYHLHLLLSLDNLRTPSCGYDNSHQMGWLGFKYPKKHLTYKITNYSKKMKNSDVKHIIKEAFGAWSKVTNLTFTRKLKGSKGNVDIDVRFGVGNHGDNYPFDGAGKVLAHASYGYVHFDDKERWSKHSRSNVVNLYSVATHEIGHALGLAHSTHERAMMYAYYNDRHPVMRLHIDDIKV